jgi:hypothetical protein
LLGCYKILSSLTKWNNYCQGLGKKKDPNTPNTTPSNKRKTLGMSMDTNGDMSIGEITNSCGKESSGDKTSAPPSLPNSCKHSKADHAANFAAKNAQEILRKMA